MTDVVIIGVMCCAISFGAGVQWRNQFVIQTASRIREDTKVLIDCNEELTSTLDELTEQNTQLVTTLDKASGKIDELISENQEWRDICEKLSEELEMIDMLVFWDNDLKEEYEKEKKQYKEEIKNIYEE